MSACPYLRYKGSNQMTFLEWDAANGNIKTENFSCAIPSLSKNKGVTRDELNQYCHNRCEECSRYCSYYQNLEKLDKKIENVKKIFRRK